MNNYPGYGGTVTANVIVFKNRVVGGDVCSSDVNGFIGTFEYPDNALPKESDAETQGQTGTETAPETEG